jgi:hypothetical protein
MMARSYKTTIWRGSGSLEEIWEEDEASDSGIEKALIWSMGDDKSLDWSHAASL